ncbi:Uncharacterised protein [Mycobacteroides abscessus subsp. abscessus]|nr:Uncharacterised protein [Mycobacteroides abscessus subsp. abscessus]
MNEAARDPPLSPLDELDSSGAGGGPVEEFREHVIGRRMLAEAVGLSGAVIVRGAGDDEVVVVGETPHDLAFVRRVVPVVDFEAVETGGDELAHRGIGDDESAHRRPGVGEDGDPSRLGDEADRGDRVDRRQGDVVLPVAGEDRGERLRPGLDDAGGDECVGDVGAPDRRILTGDGEHGVHVDRIVLGEAVDDEVGAVEARTARLLDDAGQARVVGVVEVGEQVDAHSFVAAGDLHPADEAESVHAGGLLGGGPSGGGVMIGDADDVDAFHRGFGNEFGRALCPVRERRVRMEIDDHEPQSIDFPSRCCSAPEGRSRPRA